MALVVAEVAEVAAAAACTLPSLATDLDEACGTVTDKSAALASPLADFAVAAAASAVAAPPPLADPVRPS